MGKKNARKGDAALLGPLLEGPPQRIAGHELDRGKADLGRVEAEAHPEGRKDGDVPFLRRPDEAELPPDVVDAVDDDVDPVEEKAVEGGIDFHEEAVDIDVGTDKGRPLVGGIDFLLAEILGVEKELAIEVARLDFVRVDDKK